MKTALTMSNTTFKLPEFVNKMMENKWLGSKTGQGFIKRRKRYSDFRFRYFGYVLLKEPFAL
jgi:3-hydroxyacyl-CoA dehydrogenase